MTLAPRLLELVEYQTCALPEGDLTRELGQALWRDYGDKVAVSEPSFKNGYRWELASQGYVGYIPLTPELHLALRPKVILSNVFQMLEYAYNVGQFLHRDLAQVDTLEELFERLAHVLALRVLDRARKGLYRSYIDKDDRMTYVRGRIDLRHTTQAPWDPQVQCEFQEHTADLEENRILNWTLFRLPRTGLLTERTRPTVLQAYRQVRPFASLEPVPPAQCLGRTYHRLNQDYQPLHALCHFFLEGIGPDLHSGERHMLPFLIDMASLFESFVARWLTKTGIPGHALATQAAVLWDTAERRQAKVDLVLNDQATGKPVCVLDTKYKAPDAASDDDIHQVVFYAQATGCQEAVLIYPVPLSHPTDTRVGDIHVRTLTFALGGDLDAAGAQFITALMGTIRDAGAMAEENDGLY